MRGCDFDFDWYDRNTWFPQGPDADHDTIKKRFKELAKQVHPDHMGDDAPENGREIFAEMTQEYYQALQRCKDRDEREELKRAWQTVGGIAGAIATAVAEPTIAAGVMGGIGGVVLLSTLADLVEGKDGTRLPHSGPVLTPEERAAQETARWEAEMRAYLAEGKQNSSSTASSEQGEASSSSGGSGESEPQAVVHSEWAGFWAPLKNFGQMATQQTLNLQAQNLRKLAITFDDGSSPPVHSRRAVQKPARADSWSKPPDSYAQKIRNHHREKVVDTAEPASWRPDHVDPSSWRPDHADRSSRRPDHYAGRSSSSWRPEHAVRPAVRPAHVLPVEDMIFDDALYVQSDHHVAAPQRRPSRQQSQRVSKPRGGKQPVAMPAGLAAWGCDEKLWSKVLNKKSLLQLLRNGDDERGKARIVALRQMVEGEERQGV